MKNFVKTIVLAFLMRKLNFIWNSGDLSLRNKKMKKKKKG